MHTRDRSILDGLQGAIVTTPSALPRWLAAVLPGPLVLLLLIASVACNGNSPTAPEGPGDAFTLVFAQDFEASVAGWFTDETAGPEGWCGDIRRETGTSPVAASDGSGFALVEHGACNAFWRENGFPSSGPFGVFGDFTTTFPEGGFVYDLDIYLDPAWSAGPDGSLFTYAVSVVMLDQGFPEGLRYFFLPVTKASGSLQVAGSPVNEAGWYTFRHRISDQGGSLRIGFELDRDGRVVASQPITTTALSGESTSSFDASNVGTGYAWFVAIRDGLALPIDEQERFHAR